MMVEEEDCGGQREVEDEVVVVEVSQGGQRWWKEFVMEVRGGGKSWLWW